MRRFPYEGLIFGPAMVVLALIFGGTWPKRIVGAVLGLGCSVYTLRTAPAEVAARKASRARDARRRRAEEDLE